MSRRNSCCVPKDGGFERERQQNKKRPAWTFLSGGSTSQARSNLLITWPMHYAPKHKAKHPPVTRLDSIYHASTLPNKNHPKLAGPFEFGSTYLVLCSHNHNHRWLTSILWAYCSVNNSLRPQSNWWSPVKTQSMLCGPMCSRVPGCRGTRGAELMNCVAKMHQWQWKCCSHGVCCCNSQNLPWTSSVDLSISTQKLWCITNRHEC